MAKPRNASAVPTPTTVTASTNNPHDKGYHHCFEQKDDAVLIFEVDTDSSVDTMNFVLWDLQDPVNPTMAKSMDLPVKNGHVTIRISHHLDQHLGPGPYCATLTASSTTAASDTFKSAGKVVGNALYYYKTWKGGRDCKH